MKHYLFVILFLAAKFHLSAQHVISEKGVDNIVINKSGLNDVLKVFPKGKAEYLISGGDTEWVSIRWRDGSCSHIKKWIKPDTLVIFNDKEDGIKIYFNKYNVASTIIIWGKYNFVTDRGIIVGKSTFHDLDSTYDTKEWDKSNGLNKKKPALMKLYMNILFYTKPGAKLKREDKMFIDHIEIIQ